MNDLISRKEAIDALEWKWAGKAAIDAIKQLPPAPQEQTAEWVPSTKYKGFLVCSACEDCYIEGWSDKERKWRYCPKCGKRMKREGV